MNSFNSLSGGVTPMRLSVRVNQDALGVLHPSPIGAGEAFITIRHNTDPKIAVISFAGMDQAMVTFDSMGTKGIAYTALSPIACAVNAMSIENLIHHMNESMLG